MIDNRLAKLSALRNELEQIPAQPWSNIQSWIAKATPIIRNDWANFFDDFRQVTATPRWVSLPRVGGRNVDQTVNVRAEASERSTNNTLAENFKRGVLNFLDGLLLTAPQTSQNTALDTVVLLCKRFPIFVRQLSTRQQGRLAIEIRDEYDVQYLLLALLRLHFDDVRPETWTPTYAGSSSRMDFLLRSEKIVIEVKKTRNTLRDNDVGDQLIVDIERYAQHPDCNRLVCFVFDPDHILDNPRGLEQDLSGNRENIQVTVLVSPE